MKELLNCIYDDKGNEINLDLIPVPGLCITCKSYNTDGWEDDVLCSLNRFDQRNSHEFICSVYEKQKTS